MTYFAYFAVLLVAVGLALLAGWLTEQTWVTSLGMILLLATEVTFGVIWAHSGYAVLPVVILVLAGTVWWWRKLTIPTADASTTSAERSETN